MAFIKTIELKKIHLQKIRILLMMSGIMFVLQNCKMREDIQKLKKGSWAPELVIPLIDSRVAIEEILLKEDVKNFLIKDSADGSLILVYSDTVFSTKGQNVLVFPDQNTSQANTLPNIAFPDFTITDSVTFGQVVNNIDEPERSLILDTIGSVGFIPPIPPQNGGTYDFSPNSQFDYVTFASGSLTMSITNGFKVNIRQLTFSLINDKDASTIGTFSFNNIGPGTTQNSTVDISGKTFSNDLSASIDNFQSDGAFATIDTTDKMTISFTGSNIKVSGGSGVIPAGSYGGKDTIELKTNSGDILSKLVFKSGTFTSSITSFTLDSLQTTVKFLNFVNDLGDTLTQTYGIGSSNNTVDLTGYTANFINNAADTNGIIVEFNFTSLGGTVTYNAGDEYTLNISMTGLEFSYAEGKLGYHPFNLKLDTIPITVFRNIIESGTSKIVLDSPRITVIFNNSFGIPIRAKFDTLKYEQNLFFGGNIFDVGLDFNKDGNTGDSVLFNYPPLSQAGNFSETRVVIDNTTSKNNNITKFIEDAPANLFYKVSAATAPSTQNGFILDTSYFSVAVDVQIPLSGRLDGIVVRDTFKLDVPSLEDYKYANFKLYSENGFPIDVSVQLTFYNDSLVYNSNTVIDSLFRAGDDRSILKTGTDYYSQLIPFDETRFEKIKSTKAMLLKATFQTMPQGQSVKIYASDYLLVRLGLEGKLKIK